MFEEDKDEIRESILKKTIRFFKYNKLALIFIIVIFFQSGIALFGSKGLMTRLKLESEKKQYEKMLNDELKKTDSLKLEIKELNTSDRKIEKVAREKYGMTKDGEKIIKIKVDSTK
ncbi:MAG: septum formation initiator family protein [Ignavibacteriae bacterium]|nr:septum formation initiator family protein [Ignavibacteriota bacterium]